MADPGLPAGYTPTTRATAAPAAQASAAPAPAAPTGLPAGYTPRQQPPPAAPAAAPTAPAPPPGQQGPPGYLNSTSATPAPTWQDYAALYGNEWAMDTIPALRARADAARLSVGPTGTAAAEAAGSATSLSQLLQLTSLLAPGSGPLLAGGVHEGLKSYMNQPEWIPTGKDLERVVGDTSFGAITGGLGGVAAKAAPIAAPAAAKTAQFGIPAAAAVAMHQLFGGGDITREAMHIVPELGAAFGLKAPWEALGEYGKSALSTAAAQQAIKSLLMGAYSAARNAAGPPDQWNRWVPGQ